MAQKFFDVDDASILRVIAGLREVLKAGTSIQTRERIGDAAIAIIKERTQEQMVDSEERQFREYARSYAEDKSDFLGRTISTMSVDLTLTGQMFGALRREAIGSDLIRLFFENTSSGPGEPTAPEKAEAHHKGLGQKKRPFFEVGKEESERIIFDKLVFAATQEKVLFLTKVFQ